VSWKGVRWRIKIEFQDILAILFVACFFYVAINSYLGYRDTEYELLRILVPLITIILGGYFGQGVIKRWRSTNGVIEKQEPPI